jgi:16S rRNA C1402 (ribose-2'-O) methylase RsmI
MNRRIASKRGARSERLVYPITRKVMIARELTTIHESFIEGTATEVAEYFAQHPTEVRGEFVVLVTV